MFLFMKIKPWIVSVKLGLVTVSVETIMAPNETLAIERGLMILTENTQLLNMDLSQWNKKATLAK